MSEPNFFFTYVFPVLAVVLSIPIAIFTSLLTPKISRWFMMKDLKKLGKRINSLNSKLLDLDRFYENPIFASAKRSNLQLEILSSSFWFIGSFTWLIVMAFSFENKPVPQPSTSFQIFKFIIIILSQLVAVIFESRLLNRINNLKKFNSELLTYPDSQKKISNEVNQLIDQMFKLHQEIKE
jgi:hypothetical protein